MIDALGLGGVPPVGALPVCSLVLPSRAEVTCLCDITLPLMRLYWQLSLVRFDR